MASLFQTILHLFVPHSDNNHKARLRHHSGLLSLVLIVLVARAGIQIVTTTSPQVLGYASSITPAAILEFTNRERGESGIHHLRLDSQLSQAAQQKAQDMFDRDYWAHITPTGEPPWKFISTTGYTYLYAGENLARDFSDSESVVQAWMKSPTHKENLLNSNYDDIGIAVVNGNLAGVETTLVVQMFGARRIATQPSQLVAGKSIAPTDAPATSTGEARDIQPPTQSAENISNLSNLSRLSQPSVPPFNPFYLTRALGIAVALLLVVVLALDIIVMSRRQLGRIAGHTWAHLAFVIMGLGLMILSRPGVII